jgi:hypothetical protein
MLFTFGYGYVASLVASEQLARKKAADAAQAALASVPAVAPPAEKIEKLAA